MSFSLLRITCRICEKPKKSPVKASVAPTWGTLATQMRKIANEIICGGLGGNTFAISTAHLKIISYAINV